MYQQEPQTPPPPYYPPPYPPQKKGMSAGAITAVILSVVVFFSAFGALFYLRFLKDKPTVEPTETPPVTSPPVSMTQPPETDPIVTLPPDPELPPSIYEENLLALNPYEAQHLGANPVYYYPHPSLNLAIDLRGEEEAARMMYAYPTPTGFVVTSRQAIIYEFLSLRDYRAGIEISGITVTVELLTEDEALDVEAERAASTADDAGNYILTPWQDKYLYIWDTTGLGPDPAWYASQLYDSPVFFDRFYLESHLTARVPGIEIEETPFDAAREAQALLRLLEENPAKFEWRYLMPPYQEDPEAHPAPNAAILEALIDEPIYDYMTMDLNGDGWPEHIVHASTMSDLAYGLDGYWAVFTETRGGLRLIGFSSMGSATMVYGDEKFYYMASSFYGMPGEAHLFLDVHPIPVPVEEERSFAYVTYLPISEIIQLEYEGQDPGEYRDRRMIPKVIQYDDGGWSMEFYLYRSTEYDEYIVLAEEISGHGLAFKGIPLEGPVEVGEIRDFLITEYPDFPLADNDWMNAVPFEDVLSLGPPISYDKIISVLPHPELLWR